MRNPGEFYAPIGAGPFRGIPAIHLVDTSEMALEADIPALIENFINTYGLSYPGKTFIYISRYLDQRLAARFRELGFYLIADINATPLEGWVNECNHVMFSPVNHGVINKIDSYVYAPDTDVQILEPEFTPKTRVVPKFLLIRELTENVAAFLANTQYPWCIQMTARPIFKIPLILK